MARSRHLADGYRTYVEVDWPDGATERTNRACLVAVNVEKPPADLDQLAATPGWILTL